MTHYRVFVFVRSGYHAVETINLQSTHMHMAGKKKKRRKKVDKLYGIVCSLIPVCGLAVLLQLKTMQASSMIPASNPILHSDCSHEIIDLLRW